MSRVWKVTVITLALALISSACSEPEPVDVAAAQEQFCADVEEHIGAIGDYGGLFEDVELTVGDVKTAGEELEPSLEAVMDSATTFQEAVEADPDSAVSIDLIEPESIEAVEEAESAFADAGDIDDDTPVIEAGVAFSSAAYQLEVAWVRLFADAGCVEDEADAKQWVSDYVSALQTDLTATGYYTGDIDGIYGPLTIEAVEALQTEAGLPVTGLPDPPTQVALQQALGERQSAQVGALQAILNAAGYYDGPVDGEWSPAVQEGLESLQADLGVPVTGVIDAATLRAFEEALADAGAPPPTTTQPETGVTTTPPTGTTAPATPTTTTVPPTTTVPAETTTILDVLTEAGQFGVLLAAIDTAGLTETLSGPGPFTLFAPTDEAFAAFGEIPTDPAVLSDLLMYHVISDDLSGFEIQAATTLTTNQGSDIAVSIDQGITLLNGEVAVTVTNLVAGNGVAHAVNGVLAPPG